MLKPSPNTISLKGLRRKRTFYSINFFGMSIVLGSILAYPFATYLKIIVAIKMGVVCINYSILPKAIYSTSLICINEISFQIVRLRQYQKYNRDMPMLSEIFLLPFVYINPFTFAFVSVLHQEDLFSTNLRSMQIKCMKLGFSCRHRSRLLQLYTQK